MRGLRARLAALLVAALAVAAHTSAAGAATASDPGIPGSGDAGITAPAVSGAFVTRGHPHAPDSSATRIIGIGEFDAGVRRVLAYRPGSLVHASYHSEDDTWLAYVAAPGGGRDLAELVIRDGSGTVLKRTYLPLARYPSMLSQARAIAIARRDHRTARAARRYGGLGHLTSSAALVDDTWEVSFWRHGSVRVRVDVSDTFGTVQGVWTGEQIAWKMARGDRYAFGDAANRWYVFWPAFALFALVMLQGGAGRSLRSWYTADVLVLLSFGLSHEAFNEGHIHWSVPLAVPPLAWLFARMTWVYLRGATPAPAGRVSAGEDRPAGRSPRRLRRLLTRQLPTWALVLVAVFAAGVRYGVDMYGSNVVDVGYAGVAGARDLLHGRTPYGNMPKDNDNGDTYAPLDYVAYVPAVAIWGDSHLEWTSGLPAAHAVSIASDLLCLAALVLVGWRWMSRRAAALLAAGWMTYPYTGWALCNNVNDLLVAALLLLAFAALPRAWLRGLLIGAAAMVKFVPILALAPLAHAGVRARARQSLWASAAAAVVVAASLAFAASYHDGWHRFVHATFGFQFNRDSPFSPWGLYHLRTAQRAAQALLLLAAAAAVLVPRERDFRQSAAGAAAAMLGVQLVLQHWFYLYIPWFFGFVLVVLVAAREQPPTGPAPSRVALPESVPEARPQVVYSAP